MIETRFSAYLAEHGFAADDLAGDLDALVDFLGAHPDLADTDDLVTAAATFLGNAIIARHPYATWQVGSDWEISGPAMSLVIVPITRRLITTPADHGEFLSTLDGWPQADRDEREREALDHLPAPELTRPTVPFVPPPMLIRTYRDDDGRVIPYGSRYPDGPPDEAYSRVSHPERFAPLVEVAEALVTHLESAYDVRVHRPPTTSGERRVELVPTTGAPVTMTLGDDVVRLSAGVLYEASFPDCSCDACDGVVEPWVDVLVDAVLGIVAGGLREHCPVGVRGWIHTNLTGLGGDRTGSSGEPAPGRSHPELRDRLAALDDGRWPAWPSRVAPGSARTGRIRRRV